MDDLIRRQATYLALVEKGQASKRYKLGETWELNGEEIREVLDALPSAQPGIIYCKDCKWYGRADKRRFYRGMDCLQKRIDTIVPDRDFCSKAERREQDE